RCSSIAARRPWAAAAGGRSAVIDPRKIRAAPRDGAAPPLARSEQDVGADRGVGIAEAHGQTHALTELEAPAAREHGDERVEIAVVLPAHEAHRRARLAEHADHFGEVEVPLEH